MTPPYSSAQPHPLVRLSSGGPITEEAPSSSSTVIEPTHNSSSNLTVFDSICNSTSADYCRRARPITESVPASIPQNIPIVIDSWTARRMRWIEANPRPSANPIIAGPITEVAAISNSDVDNSLAEALKSHKRKFMHDRRINRQNLNEKEDKKGFNKHGAIRSITDLTHFMSAVDIIKFGKFKDIRNAVYVLSDCGTKVTTPQNNSIPWPILWLLGRYNTKHRLSDGSLPPIRHIKSKLDHFANKVRWMWHYRNNEMDPVLKKLKTAIKQKTKPPYCRELIPPELEQ